MTSRRLKLSFVSLILAAGCSGNDTSGAGSTTTTSTSSATASARAPALLPPSTTPVSPRASAAGSNACASATPSGEKVAVRVDVDDDGQPDQVYVQGVTVSVALTGGGLLRQDISGPDGEPLPTNGGQQAGSDTPRLGFLRVTATQEERDQLLVVTEAPARADSQAGSAVLIDKVGCDLGFVLNREGRPYTFVVGTDAKTDERFGVACPDIDGDGRTDLTGTTARPRGDGFAVHRVAVRLNGSQIENGPADDVTIMSNAAEQVESLDQAVCGSDRAVYVGGPAGQG